MASIRLAENLELGDNKLIRCARCGRELCKTSENWKLFASRYVDDENSNLLKLHSDLAVFEYACPRCGVLLDVELSRKDEEPLWSVQLR